MPTNCLSVFDHFAGLALKGLKQIRKCNHQKHPNIKPIINNINKSNCLEQKYGLIIEKNNDNTETFIEYQIDSKVARNEETVGKTNSHEKPPQERSTNCHEIQRNFHDSENDNEENQLIVTETNIANNNNENNRLHNNGSNIENGINESTVKSRQISIHFR